MLRWLVLVLAALPVVLASAAFAEDVNALARNFEAKEPRLTLGVHPYLSAVELHQRFVPLLEYIEARLGSPIGLKIASSYTETLELCVNGEVDLAFVGPSLYVKITRQNPRVKPLGMVRGKHPRLRGVIVVREDSPITDIEELKGKRVAFTSTESSMGFQVPLYLLSQHGVNLKDLSKYACLGNHTNVGYAVLAGRFDAGAVKYEMYERLQSRGLRVLAQVPEVADHLFVATARVEPRLVEKVGNILQQMHTNPHGARIIAGLRSDLTSIDPVEDVDFAAMRIYADHTETCLRDGIE